MPAVPAQKAAGASIAGFALTGREKVEQDNANDIATAILGCIPTLIFDIILLPSNGQEKRLVFEASRFLYYY